MGNKNTVPVEAVRTALSPCLGSLPGVLAKDMVVRYQICVRRRPGRDLSAAHARVSSSDVRPRVW